MAAAGAVVTPFGSGCQHHLVCFELEDLLLVHHTVQIELDIGELADLIETPIPNPGPFGQSGQRRFESYPATQFGAGLGKSDVVPPLAQRHGGFQSGRSATHDQNRGIGAPFRNALRVPTLAPLLTHRRVLSAADRCPRLIPGITDVATDALTNLVGAALSDLLRQEGVGDRRASSTDQIDDALANQAQHRLR